MADESSPVTSGALTAAARYEALVGERQPFLQRARECAALTIPALMPPQGVNGSTALYQPFQSVGADGVNNLASKLSLALFPPGSSFFRLTMDDFTESQLEQKAQAAGQPVEDMKATFEEALGKIERAVTNRMEQKGARTVNFEALQHLIVTGNGLVYIMPDGREKFYTLDRYVVKRDIDGNVLEVIVKEEVAKLALDEKTQQFIDGIPAVDSEDSGGGTANPDEKSICVFTWVRRQPDGSWKAHQEIANRAVPDSQFTYPKEKSAWLPLRWRTVPHNDYGRGRCEEYLGDLRSLEILTRSLVLFAAAASKVLFLVDESGTTDKERLAEADSGDFLDGNAKDVTVLQLEKSQDFQIANTKAEELRQRLERAFLMASAVQRQAERVTAEEIREMIGELEQSLGGVYSILAEEFQRPLVVRLLEEMQKSRQLPRLPEGTVSPQIVTGLDGLGRSSDLQRLDMFMQGMAELLGPQIVAQYINVDALLKLRATALGININGLVKSSDQVQAENQQAQQQQMAQKLGPAGIKAISDQAKSIRESAPTPGGVPPQA